MKHFLINIYPFLDKENITILHIMDLPSIWSFCGRLNHTSIPQNFFLVHNFGDVVVVRGECRAVMLGPDRHLSPHR
jgi:hypothetical protein